MPMPMGTNVVAKIQFLSLDITAFEDEKYKSAFERDFSKALAKQATAALADTGSDRGGNE